MKKMISILLVISFLLAGCASVGVRPASEVTDNNETKQRVIIVFNYPGVSLGELYTDYCDINNIDGDSLTIEQMDEIINIIKTERKDYFSKNNKSYADKYLNSEDVIETSNSSRSVIANLTDSQIKELEASEDVIRISIVEENKRPEDYSYPENTADFYIRNDISISQDFYRPDVIFVSRMNFQGVTTEIYYKYDTMRFNPASVENDNNETVRYSEVLKDDDKVAVVISNIQGSKSSPLYSEEAGYCHFKENVYNYLTKNLGFEVIDPEEYLKSGQFEMINQKVFLPLVIGKWADIRNMINKQNAFLEGCGYTEDILNINGEDKDQLLASIIVSFACQLEDN